jgi:hypothetical protein
MTSCLDALERAGAEIVIQVRWSAGRQRPPCHVAPQHRGSQRLQRVFEHLPAHDFDVVLRGVAAQVDIKVILESSPST